MPLLDSSLSPMVESGQDSTLLRSSRRLQTLDHFGVPYAIANDDDDRSELEWLEPVAGGPRLLWPGEELSRGPGVASWITVGDVTIPLFGRLLSDTQARALLPDRPGGWTPAIAIMGATKERSAAIWTADDGSVLLPFDPDEARLNLLSERYQQIAIGLRTASRQRLARRLYYRSRTLMPRRLQIWLRRRYAAVQARARFPRWPVETGLHDLMEFVLDVIQYLCSEPVPRIAAWPNGKSWALVLSHDVETSRGLEATAPVVELEKSLRLRSAWNFVPRRRYSVTPEQVRELTDDGFEVGVHGLYHDGRDLESEEMLRERLPAIRAAADRWGSTGFRSPATLRDWDLMPKLGFDHDSSYPDTDPFEPQAGGCCSWLPFFNQDTVELPMTMVQDHTLFKILCQGDERAWVEKAEFLRQRGGMALIDTHPDYLVEATIFDAYRRFLERYGDDDTAWTPLPSEVSAWWRRRADSSLQRSESGWTVTGPGEAEARVEFSPAGVWARWMSQRTALREPEGAVTKPGDRPQENERPNDQQDRRWGD